MARQGHHARSSLLNDAFERPTSREAKRTGPYRPVARISTPYLMADSYQRCRSIAPQRFAVVLRSVCCPIVGLSATQ